MLGDILLNIRFPLFNLPEIATLVSPSGLLPPDHLVSLFTLASMAYGAEERKSFLSKANLPYTCYERETTRSSSNVARKVGSLINALSNQVGFTAPKEQIDMKIQANQVLLEEANQILLAEDVDDL